MDGNTATYTPSGSITATFDPIIEVDWNWDKMELEWKTGAQFSGTFNANVDMEIEFNHVLKDQGGPLIIFEKVI